MELRIVGCHGGETPNHRPSAFLVGDKLALDAGSLTSGLELSAQYRLDACVVSHPHLDHVRDLATLADNRIQAGCPPLVVAGSSGTLKALRECLFNDRIWPDFARLPSPDAPTIRYLELPMEQTISLGEKRVRLVPVHHSIEASAIIVEGEDGVLAYSGDTGPTDRLWEYLNGVEGLKALLLEVSFPNSRQWLATASGHHTPRTVAQDLQKYRAPEELPVLLFHIKPAFQSEIERECAGLKGLNLTILASDDQFVL